MSGFINFIRQRGVVGLAVGFMLGGAVSKFVTAFVNDVINPLLSLAVDTVTLRDQVVAIGSSRILWGSMLVATIDLVILTVVAYVGFRLLKLDRLDKQS